MQVRDHRRPQVPSDELRPPEEFAVEWKVSSARLESRKPRCFVASVRLLARDSECGRSVLRSAGHSTVGRPSPPPRRCRSGRPSRSVRDSRRLRPGDGRKLRIGSSALTRHSIACPWRVSSACETSRPSPAAIRICCLTRSTPVTISVIGCSTWSRAFTSLNV